MKKLFDRLFGSLVFKIGIAIVIVETILLGLFGGYYVQYFGAEIDRRIAEQISAPGRLIQDEQLKISVISDPKQLELLLGPHLREAMAIGFDGTIYHAMDPMLIGSDIASVPDFPKDRLSADLRSQVLFTTDGPDGRNMVSITPLFSLNANQPFMFAYFKVSTLGLEQSQRQMQSVLLIGSVLCILMTSGLIFLFMQQTVLRRLITAAQFVSEIQFGKLSARLKPAGRDEIGALERGLNTMAESLERRTNQHQIAQEALRDSEERFRDFTLSSADWYWEMGPDLKIAFASYKFYQLIEELNGSPQGQSFDKLGLKAETDHSWNSLIKRLESHLAFQNFEFSWMSRDGQKHFGRINGVPVFDLDGSFKGYRGTGSDVTSQHRATEEQHALQRQLATSQKLEAVGQMAGGVAHEFNNCLAGILSFAEVARAKIDDPERVKEYLDHVISLGERATSVADQLLMFSRRRIDQPTVVQVDTAITEMEKLLITLLEHRIELQIWANDAPLYTRVDPTQLSACILNLAINARDAMPDGGTLQISCYGATVPPADERSPDDEDDIFPKAAAGDYVVVTVQDTGTGIPADILGNIFEPFFSTKEPGKGTGLGLSIVHSWVEESNGFIDVESVEGEGTTFSIYLPRSEAGKVKASALQEIDYFPGNGERVLIVDDEQSLRTTAKIILEDAGFDALVARSAEEALQIITESQKTDRIDVILTDVVMSGLSGPQLAIEAQRQYPDLAVVFMSGYPARTRKEMEKMLGDYIFVKKPFRPAQLQKAIHEALAHKTERQRL
ncbi:MULTISPECIES: ATP-binding protein [Thalassospira]|uniref:ATP-binding protein n=1 Tax=Thalassospira TaxID=168934 RepID=UPI000D75F15F|nr:MULTISPECIES: ATP-binding protein [Thalassospira]MBL4842110.1 response regulator [Thalassospira sp.]PXX34446.1 PAS domain S-box-containing protein [Thalassospira sp. 11-3]RCK42144.1 histidine kinase [Thalassospira xiamenensis]